MFLNKYLLTKILLGLLLGLTLGFIVLKIDKKLWVPIELESLNSRNIAFNNTITNKEPFDKIAIILFDDKTQFLLRKNNMPIKDFERKGKDLIKAAIEKLEEAHVNSIGINLNLSNTYNTEEDINLIKTISNFKNIVIADSEHISYLNEEIYKTISMIGFAELYPDYDKTVHKVKLESSKNNFLPSFSYLLFKTYSSKDVNKDLKAIGEFYINYDNQEIKKYSLIDLINGSINNHDLKDKIVILGIGLKSKLIKDSLLSPNNRNAYVSDSEVQAIALKNLITSTYFTKSHFHNQIFLYLIFSILLGIIFSCTPTNIRVILTTIILISIVIYSQLSYNFFYKIIEIVPLLFLVITNFFVSSFIVLQINLYEQNKKLENAFSQIKSRNTQLTETLNKLNDKINELKEVRIQLSSRAEDERKRIARELHDDTLARITDIKRHVETVINSHDLPLKPKKELGVCIQIMDNITHEIRRIINALRPSMLDNALGFISAIEHLLDELTKRSSHKIKTKLTTDIYSIKLLDVLEINLYRIIQEALNNVFKHSHASSVEIIIKEQHGQLLFLVIDNGIGFSKDIDKKNSYGLIDMRERVELLSGKIQYLKMPNNTGTVLEVTIPINKDITIIKNNLSLATPNPINKLTLML